MAAARGGRTGSVRCELVDQISCPRLFGERLFAATTAVRGAEYAAAEGALRKRLLWLPPSLDVAAPRRFMLRAVGHCDYNHGGMSFRVTQVPLPPQGSASLCLRAVRSPGNGI